MENKTLKNKIFEALGKASMCWSETPKGIFDSTNAERIGNELLHQIYKEFDVPLLNTNASDGDKPERPLQRPVKYSLAEIFKELKFGRPVESQKYLDKCILELNGE